MDVITPSCGRMHQERLRWRVIKYPSLFNPAEYKTGGISLPDRDELPCPLILRHLANVSLAVLKNFNKNSIAHYAW